MLVEVGPSGLRIDEVARRLSLTKGSFHHHFAGAAAYRTAVLERYEELIMTRLDEAKHAVVDSAPVEAIQMLPKFFDDELVTLSAAIRGWAQSNPEVAATQQRIDSHLRGLLEELWRAAVPDTTRASTAALLPYLVMVGSALASPPLGGDELAAVFELLAELATAV